MLSTGNAKMNKLNRHLTYKMVCFCLFLFIAACTSGTEESMSFSDESYKDLMLNGLDEKNIPYRIEGNSIWYSIEHSESVMAVQKNALLNLPSKYVFYEKSKQEKFLFELNKNGIDATDVVIKSEEYVVYVDERHNELAQDIFKDILGINK